MPLMPLPPLAPWVSQKNWMVPGLSKVKVKVHGLVDGALVLPGLQSFEQRKLPSSALTLWKPPAFIQVTLSPALMVRTAGMKRLPGTAMITFLEGACACAGAAPAAAPT